MASTTATALNKITNQTVEPPPPPSQTMARFSIREEEEEDTDDDVFRPKRRRFSSTSSRSKPLRHEEEDDYLDSDEDFYVSRSHERRHFSSTASGSQPQRNEDEDDDLDEDVDVEAESEAEDETDDDDDVIEGDAVVTEVQRRTCTSSRSSPAVGEVASRRLPAVGDVASRRLSAVGDVAVRSAVEKSVVTEVFSNASGTLSAVFTDPDVLDCPICLEALRAPVYQCENGHIACDSCCYKVKHKCPSCCMPIGYNRCRAIEKVIESVQVSCRYAQYGCRKTMTYNTKHGHEQLCPYVTCFCPHLTCPFAGSSKNLYLHFGIQHAASTTRFTYNTTFTLPVELNQKHIILQEQHESVIFILNHEVKEHGRAFNVDCVGPSILKTSFEFQLIAKNTETCLSIQSVPEVYSKWSEHTLKKSYLTVPSDFLGYSGNLSLHVCIKKAI